MARSRSAAYVLSAVTVLVTLVTALALDAGPAAASATDSRGSATTFSPIGCWDASVTTASGSSEPVRLVFSRRSQLVIVAPDGTFGGTWHSTGAKTFTFAFTRTLPGDDGTVIGSIRISHSATFTSADAFTSTGIATGYDLNGNQLFTAPVSSTATRA